MNITIKRAEHEDVPRLVAYGREFWEQTGYYKGAGIDYDEAQVADVTHDLIEEGLVMYAETPDGTLAGLLLVMLSTFPMNAEHLQATEWVFYVSPEYRTHGLGAHLIQQAERLLANAGVKLFTMVSLAAVEPEAANRLYEKLGFRHSETCYTKVLV